RKMVSHFSCSSTLFKLASLTLILQVISATSISRSKDDKKPSLDILEDDLEGAGFGLKKRALDAMEGAGFGFDKRALDSMEGFGFHKRALDGLEGDGFGFTKKALDSLEGTDFDFGKRSYVPLKHLIFERNRPSLPYSLAQLNKNRKRLRSQLVRFLEHHDY
uniref:Uncharacterized protein n=1 Tax=Parascaris univalens TaxID=6257 RepID=A0A915AA79_PARUN